MDRTKLLRAIYESIQWDRLYEMAPEADRQAVDELFQELRRRLPPEFEVREELLRTVAGGEVHLHCDGASKGNPGPAGIGIVATTTDGRQVAAWGDTIGRATNNVAEYRAAIEGVRKAIELDAARVRVLSDSQLLVRQVNGQYQVKSPDLKPLHAELTELLGALDEWDVRHVSREENQQADRIAARQAAQASKQPG